MTGSPSFVSTTHLSAQSAIMTKDENMEGPRIKIELKPIDIAIELVGVLGLLILIGLPIYFFNQLPESIPTHFGANGEPDGFSKKGTIWMLPTVGLILYAGMFWLNKYPHNFNYPQQVTRENAQHLYTVGTRMVRTLNAIITCVFICISYSTVQTSLGNETGLAKWMIPIFIILIFGTTGCFLYKSMRKGVLADKRR